MCRWNVLSHFRRTSEGHLATKQSIAIVRLFKDKKDYIVAENQQLFLNGKKLEVDVACSAMDVVNGLHKVGRFVSTTVCKILAETVRLLIYFRWRIIFQKHSKNGMLPDHRLFSFGPKFII